MKAPNTADTGTVITLSFAGQALLSWAGYDEAGQGDVVQYNIYQDTVSFTDVSAMTPVAMAQCGTFSASISLPYGAEYFFAVTAVDELGNEDPVVICRNFILPEQCQGDFDHDQDVDGADLAVFAADFGRKDCPCESSGGLMMSSAASTEDQDFQEIQNLQDEIIGLRAELAAKEKRLEELVSSAAR